MRQNPLVVMCSHLAVVQLHGDEPKKSIIARSTMKLEFVALELAGSEVEWLKNFLAYIPLGMKPILSISMYCDNQSAIAIFENKTFNGKNIHIQL